MFPNPDGTYIVFILLAIVVFYISPYLLYSLKSKVVSEAETEEYTMTGNEALAKYGIKNNEPMPITGIHYHPFFEYADVYVRVPGIEFIVVYDENSVNKLERSNTRSILIVFKKEFLEKPIGTVSKGLNYTTFIEQVILNPKNIVSMTLFYPKALE